jgi:hypothetical protein
MDGLQQRVVWTQWNRGKFYSPIGNLTPTFPTVASRCTDWAVSAPGTVYDNWANHSSVIETYIPTLILFPGGKYSQNPNISLLLQRRHRLGKIWVFNLPFCQLVRLCCFPFLLIWFCSRKLNVNSRNAEAGTRPQLGHDIKASSVRNVSALSEMKILNTP